MDIHKEYTALMEKRFSFAKQGSYEQRGQYIFLLNAPYHYLVEASMLAYLKDTPLATLRDTLDYFNGITPVGLAPDDAGEDL